MKILFATPPIAASARYGQLEGAGSSAPALGLLSLAAVIRQAGHQVAVIDAAALQLDPVSFQKRAVAFDADVLALTATTLTVSAAAATAQRTKASQPALQVLLGGPHVSALPEETLERFPEFDMAVLREGETTLLELLTALAENCPVERIQGLAWRKDGVVRITEPRAPISDLDNLPLPAWDLLEDFPGSYTPAPFKVRQLPAVSMVTSRGCPNHCLFCDRSVFGDRCRFQSAEKVVAQLGTLRESFGVREVSFEDDTFVSHRGRAIEICRRLTELDLGLIWSCLARVNEVDAELLALMRQAGCWQVSYGIESGSQRILDTVCKNITLEQIERTLQLTRAARLRSKGFFILGHPGETPDSLRSTIDFALRLPLNDISVSLMTPFPGTELYRRAAEFGTLDPDWTQMNLLAPAFIPFGLNAKALLAAQGELLRRFYLRPGRLFDYGGRLLRHPRLALPLWRSGKALFRRILSD